MPKFGSLRHADVLGGMSIFNMVLHASHICTRNSSKISRYRACTTGIFSLLRGNLQPTVYSTCQMSNPQTSFRNYLHPLQYDLSALALYRWHPSQAPSATVAQEAEPVGTIWRPPCRDLQKCYSRRASSGTPGKLLRAIQACCKPDEEGE